MVFGPIAIGPACIGFFESETQFHGELIAGRLTDALGSILDRASRQCPNQE